MLYRRFKTKGIIDQDMDQRLSVITIGADDLPAMRNFYEGTFGWKPVAANNDIVFYRMNGFLFSLCRRKPLAEFIGISPDGNGFRGVSFGYNVSTEQEVRDLYEHVKSKAVTIISEPRQPPFGGLFFYFQDIEGNVLEIAFNPYVVMGEDGNAIDHKPIDDL